MQMLAQGSTQRRQRLDRQRGGFAVELEGDGDSIHNNFLSLSGAAEGVKGWKNFPFHPFNPFTLSRARRTYTPTMRRRYQLLASASVGGSHSAWAAVAAAAMLSWSSGWADQRGLRPGGRVAGAAPAAPSAMRGFGHGSVFAQHHARSYGDDGRRVGRAATVAHIGAFALAACGTLQCDDQLILARARSVLGR